MVRKAGKHVFKYEILDLISGLTLGVWEADSRCQALDALAQLVGYEDYDHLQIAEHVRSCAITIRRI